MSHSAAWQPAGLLPTPNVSQRLHGGVETADTADFKYGVDGRRRDAGGLQSIG
jgi:hypothetical protein